MALDSHQESDWGQEMTHRTPSFLAIASLIVIGGAAVAQSLPGGLPDNGFPTDGGVPGMDTGMPGNGQNPGSMPGDTGAGGDGSSESVDEANDTACQGDTFDPTSDPEWDNAFPITIAEMPINPPGNKNPPMMRMDPICECPGIFGYPSLGLGVTYWQPMFLVETEKMAGCSAAWGGDSLLSGYFELNSEQGFFKDERGSAQATKMQVHVYEYPLFSFFDTFKATSCASAAGVDMMFMSEIDSMWQDDAWSAVMNPEATLFTSKIAQAACAVDSVAANINFPLEPLFWCAGTWGGIYPMSGTANQSLYTFQLNHLVMAKFLALAHRVGMAYTTIGPSATCFGHPNPIWTKSQYRVDQVYPISRDGSPLVIGAMPIKQRPFMITNTPALESTVDLIWQGQQCCMRFYY